MPIGIRESAFGRPTWLFPVVIRATCGNHGKTMGLAAFRVKILGKGAFYRLQAAAFEEYRLGTLRSRLGWLPEIRVPLLYPQGL